jgi:hypothetical protein
MARSHTPISGSLDIDTFSAAIAARLGGNRWSAPASPGNPGERFDCKRGDRDGGCRFPPHPRGAWDTPEGSSPTREGAYYAFPLRSPDRIKSII